MGPKRRTRKADIADDIITKKKVKCEDVTSPITGIKSETNDINTIPVDSECLKLVSNVHVYSSEEGAYNVMLSQTNINRNNNKFYIIQLLEDDDGDYYVWTRWGRIGVVGQHNLKSCGSELDDATGDFCKKFALKTKNNWSDRKSFVKVEGKYGIVEVNHDEPEKPLKQKPAKPIASELPEKIQNLIKMISSIEEMEDMVKNMMYDSSRAPLGELTKKQIKNGFSSLKKINDLISAEKNGDELVKACDKFYTQIPHNFGMKRPPLIRTLYDLRKEVDLLETLGEIELAFRVLQGSDKNLHPVDAKYQSLKCDLTPIERDDSDFMMIDNYLQVTHGRTHSQYTLNILDAFSIDRQGEKEKFVDKGNKMLLWHGTRLTNMVGILSQGLRIAPPEAPVTGYMFGKGVYFADISSKSANYCHTTKKKNTGFLILCQVSLGDQRMLTEADNGADKLPKNVSSVKGVGRVHPNPDQHIVWEDETVIPAGEPVEDQNSEDKKVLNYNEYIVYNPDQIRMRFLVQVEFNYN